MAFTDFSNDHLVGIIVFASVMATLGLQILLESVRQLLSKMVQLKGNPQTNSAYLIKLELLVAKNLIAANLNGTSDPYAIITCGTEKRFSSMVLSSRNPMWGEEFNFAVEELPIEWIMYGLVAVEVGCV
nr:BAG-associated GRAM protein 1-like isoform X3 [Quercus suber]